MRILPYLIVFALIAAADYACVRYSGTAYKHQAVSAPICWHSDLDSNAKWGGIFKPKAERDAIAETRVFVFGRERGICRCCRFSPAESMHELRFKSLGGKVNKRNSVAVCGDGVNGCHGMLQRNQITYEPRDGANGTLYFTPTDQTRADWLRIKLGERIESAPMSAYEQENA